VNIRSIAQAVVLGTLVVVGGIDVVLYLWGGVPATISAWISETSREFPILPFAAGVLCGHLFWQVRGQ
jgi:hypothetical protein